MDTAITRRDFLKYSALTGGFLLASKSTWAQPLLETGKTPETVSEDKWLPTNCWIGKQDCGVLARRVNGRIVKLEGNPKYPRNVGTLCPKGLSQIISLYDPYRIKAPLKRTNEKGVPGEWVEIGWDEALTEVGSKVKEAKAKDPKYLIWQKGRSKSGALYDSAFVNASKATYIGHGAFCSDTGYRAFEYTAGVNGVFHPDFRYCKYLLNWGWNITNAGGNKYCWITWNREFVEARERGMKVVTVDPSARGAGPHTDEWLPIKPGTDLSFFLALANVLVAKGYIDKEYLAKSTNSAFLVKSDGTFLRVNEKEQVWENEPKAFDQATNPSLEGEFSANGEKVKTAFQVFKEHIAQYTPEWAEPICGLPASRIAKLAEELGKNALIGSTITLEGAQYVYRPVGLMGYHVSQQELGFQSCRAILTVYMLLGAVDAVGGMRGDTKRSLHANFDALDKIKIKDPPYNLYLKDSKFFPINSKSPSIVAHALNDPKKWETDHDPKSTVMISHMNNAAVAFADQKAIWEAYMKLKYIAVIGPWMNETADYFADVILPTTLMEKYEGPSGVAGPYDDATAVRLPIIDPMYKAKSELEIYLGIAEKSGFLYGKDGYIDQINSQLKLTNELKLDNTKMPVPRDVFDRWAKSNGYSGIDFFEKGDIKVKAFAAKDLYASVKERTYKGIKHRLYGESLLKYQKTMKAKGAGEFFWRQYTALPTWVTPTMEKSPSEYDLYLISQKKIEFKQSRALINPILHELEPYQEVQMNRTTAIEKGIANGELVWVESHNAVTGETRKVRAKAKHTELIRPDTVSMSHHYGFWVHPLTKDSGPTPNTLFFSGEGYVVNTADQSFHVKVKVYR